jgi:hypothetical protein
MLSDRTQFSLAAATIAASATISISPAEAISFTYTADPGGYRFFEGIQGPLTAEIVGTDSFGGYQLAGANVGTGFWFGGSFIKETGPGQIWLRVTGDTDWGGIANIYGISFHCVLDIQKSCNGTKGTYFKRSIGGTMRSTTITIGDFSWGNTPYPLSFSAPTPAPTPPPTQPIIPTPLPIEPPTPTQSPEAASIPEPSSVAGLFLLGSAWLLRRKRKQTFPTGISESIN